jgi:subtilase family serine protease
MWSRRISALVAVVALFGPAAEASARWSPAAAPAAPPSCSAPVAGHRARCFSQWQRFSGDVPLSSALAPPVGLGPVDIRSAYQLPSTGGATQTIGIVDAFDNPNAEADLAVYRSAWGLPACTTANGCFRKVDQRGTGSYPPGDPGWGVEIALDLQAVSAACSACRILLVEADDNALESLGAAVATAVRLGATVVSNSYGADEFSGMLPLGEQYFTHPGVPILAASGDLGFRIASFPAVLSTTWAVGGTLLHAETDGTWTEEAWSRSGSGCSAWVAKPTVQTDPNCEMLTVVDISATAASDEGFAVYDTYGLDGDPGWITVDGTSLSAPLIAAMIGLAGNAAQVADPAYAYQHPGGLHDVVGGVNGSCGDDYLCTGVVGYDGPTGLGSPRGLGSL